MCAAGPRLKERREHVLRPRLPWSTRPLHITSLQNGWIMRTEQNLNTIVKQTGYLGMLGLDGIDVLFRKRYKQPLTLSLPLVLEFS